VVDEIPQLHHIAFEVKDWAEIQRACEWLAKNNIHLVWGPGRHIIGHNIAIYHRNADKVRVELGRVLVMLPGLGHAASLYKYQLEGLCDEFRVIALDPRGHGESDKPERGYNYHTLAKDLDGFLRALDLNDATILGHSGGCKIILTYLELYGGSRLRAIVFSDDSPCHLRDGIFSADQALAAIDAFQGPDAIAFSKGFSDQFLTDDAEESAKEAKPVHGQTLSLGRLR